MEDIEAVKQKSIQGVVSYTSRTTITYLVALGATALLSAYLTPEDFGIYFIVTSVIGVLTFLSDIGLAAALVQKKEEPSLTDLRTAFTVQQLLAGMIVLIVLALTPLWVTHSGLDQQGLILLYVLAFSFILASFKTIPSILLERSLDFNRLIIPQVVEQLLFYTIAVVLARSGWGVASFTWAVLIRSVVGLAVIYIIKPWSIGLSLSRRSLHNLLGFGVKFQANDLLARLKDDLFVVVLARFFSNQTMGYIGWAKRWSMFPYQFSVQNVMAVTFPTFSRLQHDTHLVKRGLELSLFFVALIILPILTGMVVLAYPLTVVFPVYAKWQPALPSLYFFCANIAIAAMANPFINALNALKQINVTLKLMLVMTLTTWLLTPLVVWLFGFSGVALTSVFVAGIGLYGSVVLKRTIPVKVGTHIWRQVVASMIMGIVLVGLQPLWQVSLLNLIATTLFGALIYGICLWIIGRKFLIGAVNSVAPKLVQRSPAFVRRELILVDETG